MDDLQFRKNLYADPSNITEDMHEAMQNDASKLQFAKEIEKLDDKIAAALNIDVPAGLADKLIFRQTLVSHKQEKRKKQFHIALAASIVFAVGFSLNFIQFSSAYDNLADHALAHIYHEGDFIANNDQHDITLAKLNDKMARFGSKFNASFGQLISANFCRFDGVKSLHLVFKGEKSPITVFIMPNSNELKVASNFADDKFNGRVLQYQHGNVVIIGEKNEALSQWQDKINDNISWVI